jgi:hypothetical protein
VVRAFRKARKDSAQAQRQENAMGFPGKSQGKQAGGKGSDYVDRAEKPQE